MGAHPIQVVIIDDDSDVRWIIEQSLDLAGISYASAATGSQGIQLINQHLPRLAIVDLKLGAMSGLDVIRSIRSPHKTKTLLVTGYANSIGEPLSELPLLGVIEKPFDIHELLNVVQEVLSSTA